MRNRLVAALAVVCFLAGIAGAGVARTQAEPLTIYAAASLTDVFRSYDANERYSFAGSNTLETQIVNGAPADLFASAAPLNTQRLFRQGLVEKPVTFTANRLALIVPKSNPADIHSVYDLRRKPVKLVIAAPAVPVGGYTRTVLRKMGLTSVLSKVVSQESDVRAVTGKIALGQGDAGFVYVTDARAVADDVTVIRIPGLGAAARPLRDRRRRAVEQQDGGPGLDQSAAVGEGPGGSQELRLPAAAEGPAIDRAFRAALVLAAGAVFLFLLLPIIAVFVRVPPSDLFAALGSTAALDALRVTVETNLIAMGLILGFGTPAAYWIATQRRDLSRRPRHARRVAARPAAGRRGDRPPGRLRPGGAARRARSKRSGSTSPSRRRP